jgi:hypothetical protein
MSGNLDLDKLERDAELIVSLLKDRHPGLFTWRKMLLESIEGMAEHVGRDPTQDLIHANVETIKNFLLEGMSRARRALMAGNVDLALATIEAAMSFHPMHAEAWGGWPEDKTLPRAADGEGGSQ